MTKSTQPEVRICRKYSKLLSKLYVFCIICSAVCDGNLENLQPLLEENGHLLPIIFENESNVLHLAVEAVLTRNASADIVKVGRPPFLAVTS